MRRSEAYLILAARERAIELGWGKFNPLQERWPKGSGDKSGEWKDQGSSKKKTELGDLSRKERSEYARAYVAAERETGNKAPTKAQVAKHLPDGHPMKPVRKAPSPRVAPKAPPKANSTDPQPARTTPAPTRAPGKKVAPRKTEEELRREEEQALEEYEDARERLSYEERQKLKRPPAPTPPANESTQEKIARLRNELRGIDPDSPEHFLKMQEYLGAMQRLQNEAVDNPAMSAKFKPDLTPLSHREAYERAIAAIEKVHKDSTLKPISLYSKSMKANGQYAYEVPTVGVDGQAIEHQNRDEIHISPVNKIDPELTITHEIGHFLDRRLFGGQSKWGPTYGSDDKATPEQKALWDALNNSDGIKRIQKVHQAATAYNDPERSRYSGYLLEPTETFARAYSQWIALRSGSSELQRQHQYRADNTAPSSQWQPDDFEPIANAMDDLFRSRGLLNE